MIFFDCEAVLATESTISDNFFSLTLISIKLELESISSTVIFLSSYPIKLKVKVSFTEKKFKSKIPLLLVEVYFFLFSLKMYTSLRGS